MRLTNPGVEQIEVHNKAYLAGIIDGEGSIGIYRSGPHRGCAANRLVLVVTITSTTLILLEWCQKIVGDGKIALKRQKNDKHRACWEWKIRNCKASRMLSLILPYLVIKKQQAVTAIKFAETIGNVGQRLSKETQRKRENFYREIRSLNRMGKPQCRNKI